MSKTQKQMGDGQNVNNLQSIPQHVTTIQKLTEMIQIINAQQRVGGQVRSSLRTLLEELEDEN